MYPGSARMKTGWGAALFAGALYEQAAQQLCEASDLNPADTETYLVMGKAEMASPAPLGCVEEKLARFERLQPKNASAVFLHAMALSKQDSVANRARVEGLLKQAVTLDPHYAEAYLQLGVMSFAQRRYPEAIGFYQQAIAADPVLGEAHYRLGVAYDRVGEAEKAKQELRLHDQIETAQADAVEEERRKIKQFLVVQHGAPGISEKP
jgi:tetratricopeptide (TPR) repeat protein